MERKAFPRGGATEDNAEKRNHKTSHWLSTQKKKKPKKSRNHSESDPDVDYELEERLQKETETKVTIQDVGYKTIQPKMKLLGRIAEVHENFVEVYLPGAILGTIPIHNVIEMIGSSGNGTDRYANAPALTDLFRVDQLVITEVSNVVREANAKQGKGTAVYLTVNPKNIYQGWNHKDVAQVGFLLQAFVHSVEDHGYILNCGIQDLHVFLNKKECEKYCKRLNNGNPLVKGQVVRAVVIKAKPSNVQSQVEVSVEPGKVARAEKTPPNYVEEASQLLPGMRFQLEVTKRLSNGVAVNFDEFEGFIVDRNIPQKMKDSDVGDSFLACLLYISKPLNVPMFSIVPSVVDSIVAPVREFTYGDVVKSAVVESESYGSVGLLLNKKTGTRGRIPPSYRKNAEKECKSREMHKIGNIVRCRILNFDSLSETYMCTTLESAIKERIFSASDVPVGSIVTATVTGFTEKALIVLVGAVVGYIQWYHTADAPVRSFADKFNVGQKIKGRVLKTSTGKIDVTAKESLVKKGCAMLKSYDEAIEGNVYPGTVIAVRGEGVLVGFFGGVKGIVSHSKIVANFKKGGSLNIGRLVKCKVVSCSGDKLFLSLSDSPDLDKVTVGSKCSPIVAGIDTKNRTLHVVSGSSNRGRIPLYHLHDSQKLADEIFHTYSIGDVVQDARCFSSEPDVVFSTRGSVRRFFDSDVGKVLIKKGSSALRDGDIIPCFVKSLGSDVTLCTPLADSHFVHRIRKEQLITKDVQEGDFLPLVVKNVQKKIFDEHVLEVLQDKVQASVDFLADILDGNKILEEHDKKCASPLSTFSVGEKVTGPVESTESGYKICMPNGVKGHVNSYCTDEDPTVGEIVNGIVIYLDYERSELIISLQESVQSKLLVEKGPPDVEDGAVLSGRIVRGFTGFYLALMCVEDTLRRGFVPKHVYPSRRAPLAVSKGMVGEELEFTVIRKYGNDLLCIPTKKAKKLKRKVNHVTVNTDDKQCENNASEGKKRRRRKRKNSASSVEPEAIVSENESVQNVPPKRRKNKNKKRLVSSVNGQDSQNGPSEIDSKNTSPLKMKMTEGVTANENCQTDCNPSKGNAQKHGIIQKLGIIKKQFKKKVVNANAGLPKKMKNEKVFTAIVGSVTGTATKSPLACSSDNTKKSLNKAKLGKNRDIFKIIRKPAKRLKKSGTDKPVRKL